MADEGAGGRMVLVEVFADRAAGHYGDNLVRLARAAIAAGREVTAVCVQGVHPQIRGALEASGVEVIDRPIGLVARAMLAGSRLLRPVHSATVRVAGRTLLPPRVRYVAKSMTEVAALRTAGRKSTAAGKKGTVVLLTACQALTATTAALSGVAHIRLVHDVGVPEGPALRALERAFARGADQAVLVCTTDAVRSSLLARHHRLHAVVQPFTVDDPDMYLSPEERGPARNALGIGEDEFAACMVGGWWDYKDIDVVVRALEALSRPVALVLVGNPMQPERLEQPAAAGGGRLVALQGSVTESELRQVYAASDCALVTRVPGFNREASTVYDATRYGVPLIVTDHDPSMHDRLAAEESVRLVPAGDSDALAAALHALGASPLPRPDGGASGRLGLVTGESKVRYFEELSAGLHNRAVTSAEGI